jgi:hypothetical protein
VNPVDRGCSKVHWHGLKRPKIVVKKLFSFMGQFLSKTAAIFAIFDVFSPELQYI